MPATDFGLSFSNKPPIFQVYGTKRKNGDHPSEDGMVETVAKRQCPGISQREEAAECMMTEDQQEEMTSDIAHQFTGSATNCIQISTQQAPIQWSTFPDYVIPDTVPETLPSQPENNNNLMLSRHQQVSQGEMIMDLNGETYSSHVLTPSTDDQDMASSNMEGEGAPNPSQYRQPYCDRNVVTGDASPASGRVRCFCKPAWESMTDMRPYVSDYY